MVAAEFPEIRLDRFTGNLERAIEYVAAFPQQKFDAIISRGGTAGVLRKHVDIPVIEIEISILDMLRALKLAESCSEPFAVVGYGSIVHIASSLCDVLQCDRPLIREITARRVRQSIEELRDQGIRLILGDVIAVQAAEEAGLLSILITSSRESVTAAFESAAALCRSMVRDQTFYKLYQAIVDCIQTGIVVFDRSGNQIQANHQSKLMDQELLMTTLRKCIPHLQEQGEMHLYRQSNRLLLEITGQLLQADGNQYSCFFVRSSHKAASIVPGVAVDHPVELPPGRQILLSALKSRLGTAALEKGIQGSGTVAIIGEPGMQKTSLARSLHCRGPRQNGLFLRVSCEVLQERQWTRFASNINSPVNGQGCTVFFENVHRLAPSIQELLSTYIEDTLLYKRNHIICSSIADLQEMVMQERFYLPLYKQLCQILLPLPPLREWREELPVLVNLLINQFNIEHNKSVGGIRQEALEILRDYNWPLNLVQLEQVLSSSVRDAVSYMLSPEEIQRALQEQRTFQQAKEPQAESDRGLMIDLHKPLDEIERSVIQQILAEEGMNQSAAAKRLGISRSTLWRKLK